MQQGKNWGILPRPVIICLVVGLLTCFTSVPALAMDDSAALKSLETFSQGWMAKLCEISRKNGESIDKMEVAPDKEGYTANYTSYGPNCQVVVKKTDSKAAPYVGLISYPEKRIVKKGRTLKEVTDDPGKVESETPVTEIFRFQNGHWIYC